MFYSFKFFSFIFKSPSLLRWLIVVVVGVAPATLSFKCWPMHTLIIFLFLLLYNISVLYVIVVIVVMMMIVQCLFSPPLILFNRGLWKLLLVLLNYWHLKLMTLQLLCVFLLHSFLKELICKCQLLLWHVRIHCVVEGNLPWGPSARPDTVGGEGSYMLHWLPVGGRAKLRFLARWELLLDVSVGVQGLKRVLAAGLHLVRRLRFSCQESIVLISLSLSDLIRTMIINKPLHGLKPSAYSNYHLIILSLYKYALFSVCINPLWFSHEE